MQYYFTSIGVTSILMLRLQATPLPSCPRSPPTWLKRLPRGESSLWKAEFLCHEDLLAGVLDVDDLELEELFSRPRCGFKHVNNVNPFVELQVPLQTCLDCDSVGFPPPDVWIPVHIDLYEVSFEDHPDSLKLKLYLHDLQANTHIPKALGSLFAELLFEPPPADSNSVAWEDLHFEIPISRDPLMDPYMELESALVCSIDLNPFLRKVMHLVTAQDLPPRGRQVRYASLLFEDDMKKPLTLSPYTPFDEYFDCCLPIPFDPISDIVDITVDFTSAREPTSSAMNYFAHTFTALQNSLVLTNCNLPIRDSRRKRSLRQMMFSTTFLSYIPSTSASLFDACTNLKSRVTKMLSPISLSDFHKVKWRKVSIAAEMNEAQNFWNEAKVSTDLISLRNLQAELAIYTVSSGKITNENYAKKVQDQSIYDVPPDRQSKVVPEELFKAAPSLPERSDDDYSRVVDVYLKLHGHEDSSIQTLTTSSGRQQDKRSLSMLPLPEESKRVETEHEEYQDCAILIAENLFEDASIITQLALAGIKCFDCALQSPIHFIIDLTTGVSILFETQLQSPQFLRQYILELTTNAFKFLGIWIIILGEGNNSNCQEYFQLIQCLSSFPCDIIVRWSTLKRFPKMMQSMIDRAIQHVALKEGRMMHDFYNRDYLLNISSPLFAARCEFLQLFPSINFFVAAYLLSKINILRLIGPAPSQDPLDGHRTSLNQFFTGLRVLCSVVIDVGSSTKYCRQYQPMPTSELTYVKSKTLPDGQTVNYYHSIII